MKGKPEPGAHIEDVASAKIVRFPASASLDDAGRERLASAARSHGRELLGFLRRRTPSADRAEDLSQEVYARIARGGNIDRIEDLRAYLFRTARSVLIDFRRKRARDNRVLDGEGEAPDAPCDQPSIDRKLESIETLDALRSALAELPERKRRALLWARLDGLTLIEIGRRLGVSESMASRYVIEALKHCEQRLADFGSDSKG